MRTILTRTAYVGAFLLAGLAVGCGPDDDCLECLEQGEADRARCQERYDDPQDGNYHLDLEFGMCMTNAHTDEGNCWSAHNCPRYAGYYRADEYVPTVDVLGADGINPHLLPMGTATVELAAVYADIAGLTEIPDACADESQWDAFRDTYFQGIPEDVDWVEFSYLPYDDFDSLSLMQKFSYGAWSPWQVIGEATAEEGYKLDWPVWHLGFDTYVLRVRLVTEEGSSFLPKGASLHMIPPAIEWQPPTTVGFGRVITYPCSAQEACGG